MIRVLSLSFLVVIAFSVAPTNATDFFASTWLKPGVYAQYTFNSGTIHFPDNSSLGFYSVKFIDGTFRWDCIETNETFAQLHVTLKYTQTTLNGKAVANTSRQLTTDIFVNKVNRETYFLNGTLIGTTTLWLPASPATGENITVWNVPPDEIQLPVTYPANDLVATPQGSKRSFEIQGTGTICGSSVSFNILSESSTGLMAQETPLDNEPAFVSTGLTLFRYAGLMTFADTNIVLGPSDSSGMLTLVLAIAAFFVGVFILMFSVYFNSRKRGR